MNTAFAVGVLAFLCYAAFFAIVKIWAKYEIDPEQYERLSHVFERYPDLGKHLLTFRDDGRITTSEQDKIQKIARKRTRRLATEATIAARKDMILKHIDKPFLKNN